MFTTFARQPRTVDIVNTLFDTDRAIKAPAIYRIESGLYHRTRLALGLEFFGRHPEELLDAVYYQLAQESGSFDLADVVWCSLFEYIPLA